MNRNFLAAAALVLTAAGCGPKVEPRPIMQNGGLIEERTEETVARARAEAAAEQARLRAERAEAVGLAMETCRPGECAALLRGELALGMGEAQVFAATGTAAEAWDRRASNHTVVLTSTHAGAVAPRDAVGEIAMVVLQDGAVRSYTYREPQGLRIVSTPADATYAGRLAAQADALLREGDDFTMRGDFVRALDRYDRADVLRPGHPETTLRIAQALDKQLRPLEATLRYRLFLHQLELERIGAIGDAHARMAEAIALAQQRIVVLERQRR
jgi:hypothetical protein